ncbi:MAG: hypothetical protein RIR62_3118 [Pseudomonadota bacterium]|jgi:putative tricarboxylic transport membrane protein
MSGRNDRTRRPDGAAFFIAAGLAALGGLLIWDASRIPDLAGYAGIGPADVPRLIGWGLVLLAIGTVVEGMRGGFDPRPRQQPVPVLWILGGLVGQLLLLHWAGFVLASAVLFAGTAGAFGKRNIAVTLPVGIVFAACVYGVFDRILQLNLPGGPLEMMVFGG